jgi:hypothetical protein
MRGFFKPWRRKIGVLTLGLALICIVECATSYGHSDSQVFGNHWCGLFFDRGELCWLTQTDDPLGHPESRLASPEPCLVRIAPGWIVVLLLLILSAYLLLSTPRQSNQKKTPEPIAQNIA